VERLGLRTGEIKMQVYLFDMKNMEHLCDDFEEEEE